MKGGKTMANGLGVSVAVSSSRRSLGEGGRSMKIIKDVGCYAAGKSIDRGSALQDGLRARLGIFRTANRNLFCNYDG